MTWHADAELVRRYADGALDDPEAWSLEAHLMRCGECRAAVAEHVDQPRLEAVWREIEDAVDAPAPKPAERLLRSAGIAPHTARLLAATPSLTLSWLGAVATVLAFSVIAAHVDPRGYSLFLALVPLVPLAGVAVAFGPGVDPTYEIGLAAPMRSLHLLLVRSLAVLVTSALLAAVGALALPGIGFETVAWLLPSLALVALVVALGTRFDPVRAAAGVAAAWIALVGVSAAVADDRLAAFREPAQICFALAFAAAAAVIALRRSTFEQPTRM